MKNFSEKLIQHLIEYKENILGIKSRGKFKDEEYDHILEKYISSFNFLPSIQTDAINLLYKKNVKLHIYSDHLNSSQIACFNLFISLLINKDLANKVFKSIIPEFKELLNIEFEYYDDKDYLNEGRNKKANKRDIGTDADVAIFYSNENNERCLCLLEHKLSEKEFTNCGAFKSHKNDKKDFCKDFTKIWSDTNKCYYHANCNYGYWNLTKDKNSIFDSVKLFNYKGICPFKNSLQQLWRNMLMTQAIENDSNNDIKKTCFGVIYHSENDKLFKLKEFTGESDTIIAFTSLLKDKNKFLVITIQDIINKVKEVEDTIPKWVEEYEEKYININN